MALEDKWRWPVITQAFAANDKSWVVLRIKETWIETAWYKIILSTDDTTSPSLRLPDFSCLHHPSNPYDSSCCSNCSTVALVKNKLSMRPPWECGIDLLHIQSKASLDQQVEQHTIPILDYDKMRLASDVHANVVFSPTFFCRESSGGGLCASHRLVLWRTNDHVITIHSTSQGGGISGEPEATFTPAPQGKTQELLTAWGHAKLRLSADFQLLGFLMAHRIHLWSLETNQKLHTVFLEDIPGLRSQVLVLGHVYSLFGTFHEGGEMVLTLTHSDQVVWRCESFLEPGEVESGTRQSSVVGEDWMSDVYTQTEST